MRQIARIPSVVAATVFGGAVLLSACSGTPAESGNQQVTGSQETATTTVGAGDGEAAMSDPSGATGPPAKSQPPAATPSPANPSEGSSGQPPPAATSCDTAALEISVVQQQGAAGSLLYTLGFRNVSDAKCSLHGFPGVSLVGFDNGTQLGQPAVREGEAAEPVLLAPDASGYASLRVTRAENFAAEACGIVPANGLRIYPPDQTAAAYLPLEGVNGCDSRDAELLSVRAVFDSPQ
ncbi:DUF4232 domain-containing protein [Corynebacterium halotolerans]|uniref:DUF4232 domain-containing protein n=1 Tax=Corynebacterium halotolerans TaxID=225326 RepID=UPI003CF3474A